VTLGSRLLFGTELAAVGRFEAETRALDLVGAGHMHERWEVADFLASAEVFRTGGSARADAPRWESAEGETAERLRSLGIVSTVRVRPERAGKAVAQHQLIVGGPTSRL
jgi:hypothetical protein